MDNTAYIKLGNKILDRIQGSFSFSISREERISIAADILNSLLAEEENTQFLQYFRNPDDKSLFLKKFFSYDEIEGFIRDYSVEDISINSTDTIFMHTSHKGLVRTDKRFPNLEYLNFFIKKLRVFAGKKTLKKINDFELPFIEGRVNMVYSPFGPQVTITKIKESPLSIIELIEKSSLDYRMAAFLWLAVEGFSLRPANILIVGGPGAGKTTLLNALLSFIPDNERVVVIEDTMELNTQFMDNFSRLESDEDMSLEALVKNTLRMRPERILIGEVRGREAQDMMTAMNIGKYCMGTIHAPNTKEAFSRLENPPMNIHPALINLIDLFVVLKKFKSGKFASRTIDEISETSFMEQKRPLVSILWKYNFKKSRIEDVSPFAIFRDKMAEATGKSPVDILDEWEIRGKILYILHKKGLFTFKEVTKFCSFYNKDANKALESLKTSHKDLKKMNIKMI